MFFGNHGGGNVDNSKYYNLLGVNKDDSDDVIKKAYRKLAMKWHPDKNIDNKEEAQQKFNEISNAYSVLSDPSKRKMYDQFGEEAASMNGGGEMPNFNPGDIFESMFGMNLGGQHRERRESKTKPLVEVIELNLEDFYCGKTLKVNIEKEKTIDSNGKVDNNGFKTCKECDGNGIKNIVRRMGPMVQQMQVQCDKCGAKGFRLKSGYKIESFREKIEIKIEKGSENEHQIVLNGQGNYDYKTKSYGDLVIVLKEKEHKTFTRRGYDLYTTLDINIIEALSGVETHIKHLDKRELYIRTEEIIENGMVKVVKYEGMPRDNTNLLKGNLYIKFNVTYPKVISSKQKKLLRKLFEMKQMSDTSKQPCVLTDVNSESTQEDDREDFDGNPGVQCAQQ